MNSIKRLLLLLVFITSFQQARSGTSRNSCDKNNCDCTKLRSYKTDIVKDGHNCDIINSYGNRSNQYINEVECFDANKTKLYTYSYSNDLWLNEANSNDPRDAKLTVNLKSVISNEDGLSRRMFLKREVCSSCDCDKSESENAAKYKKLINDRGFACDTVTTSSYGKEGLEVKCHNAPDIVYNIGPDLPFEKRVVTKTHYTVTQLNTLWQ